MGFNEIYGGTETRQTRAGFVDEEKMKEERRNREFVFITQRSRILFKGAKSEGKSNEVLNLRICTNQTLSLIFGLA